MHLYLYYRLLEGEQKWRDVIIATVIFVTVIVIGGIYIKSSAYGYTESAILFLAAVIAAGCYWIGSKRGE